MTAHVRRRRPNPRHLDWKARAQAGETLTSIAASANVSLSAVSYALKRMGAILPQRPPLWTEETLAAWKRRYEAGESLHSIALDGGASVPTIRKALACAGVVMRTRWGNERARQGRGI